MAKLIGTDPNQVQSNADLGSAAFKDATEFLLSRGSNLDKIEQTITDTAADIKVYDTSLDSDGGAWRKRVTGTSWYNEELSTDVRGSRKEFPAVALLVLGSNLNGTEGISDDLIIYDADDPSLPMWMKFKFKLGSGFNSAVDMINGKMVFGATNNGILITDFIADTMIIYNHVHRHTYKSISPSRLGRTSLVTFENRVENATTGYEIANEYVYDVSMTVVPGAIIDPSTKLPRPHICVGTDGGFTVIQDNGETITQASLYGRNEIKKVKISEDGKRIYGVAKSSVGVDSVYFNEDYRTGNFPIAETLATRYPIFASGTYGMQMQTLGSAADYGMSEDGNVISANNSIGFGNLDLYHSDPTKSMFNHISTNFNTGWKNGDIRLATLNGIEEGYLSDSNVVSNGTFASNVNGWFGDSQASVTWNSGGYAVVTTTGDSVFAIGQSGILEVGAKYAVSFRVNPDTSNNTFRVRLGGSGTQWSQSSLPANTWTQITYDDVGIATADGTTLEIGTIGGVVNTFLIDDIVVRKLSVEDRSFNDDGLAVVTNGNLLRTPVADGAELVGYSGFNSSNYLFQPYNADMNFTNKLCVMFWLKRMDATQDILHLGPFRTRNSETSFYVMFDSGYDLRFTITPDGSTEYNSEVQYSGALDGWHHICCVFDRPTVSIYVNGEKQNLGAGSIRDFDIYSQSSARNGLYIGQGPVYGDMNSTSEISMLKISKTPPTAEQVKKIYYDEKELFSNGAKATLYGTNRGVFDVGRDKVTGETHVLTTSGRSTFQGLRRIDNNERSFGGGSRVHAVNGLIAED